MTALISKTISHAFVNSSDDPRLGEILDSYLAALEQGQAPPIEQVLAEHQDLRSSLEPALRKLRELHRVALGIDHDTSAPQTIGHGLLEGGVLGDFRIHREIGRGGMGVVYEAEQISLSRRVALKILPFAAMLDPRHLQRFKNEALAAAHLAHPNIVDVYGIGRERGVHFYVMRLIEGQTLAAVIEVMRAQGSGVGAQDDSAAPLPPGESRERASGADPISVGNALSGVPQPRGDVALGATVGSSSSAASFRLSSLELRTPAADTVRSPLAALSTLRTDKPRDFFRLVAELGIQAAEALDHAHQMGIVHRDIKPSNLILQCSHLAPRDGASKYHHAERDDYTPKLWITDFGLARIESDATLTITGDLLGTLRYMSPEQAEGKSAVLDHRTDIYSLGITLYELATLRPAFPATDRQTLLQQIAHDEPPAPRKLNAEIPADFETILLKAIAKDPHDRYGSAGDLAADLRRLVAREPILARPPGRLRRLARWSWRHRGLVAAAVILLAVTATLATAAAVLFAIERDKTVAAHDDADRERKRAEENYLTARQAVAQMLKQVADEQIAVVPGMRDVREKLLKDALVFYTKLIESSPRDAQAYIERAQVHRSLRMQSEERRDYEKAVELDPDNAAVHAALANCYFWAKKWGKPNRPFDLNLALLHAQKTLELQPDNGEAIWISSVGLADQGRQSEALGQIKAFERNAFSTASTFERLAVAYRDIGEPQLALPYARRATEMDSSSFQAHLTLAESLAAMGRIDEALESYETTLRLSPFHYARGDSRHWHRGDLLVQKGRYAEAVEDYGIAIQTNPQSYMPYKRRAVAHFHLKHFDQALADLNKAYELRPDDSTTTWWIGPKHIARCPDEQFRQGIFELIAKAITRDASDHLLFSNRAEIYLEMGRYDEALVDCAAGLNRAKSNEDRVQVLYVRTQASSDRGDQDDVQRTLEQIVKLRAAIYQTKLTTFGKVHRQTLEAMYFLAGAKWDAGQSEDGLALTKETLALNVQNHGKEDEFAVAIVRLLSLRYGQLDEPELALPYTKESYTLAAEKLGADHMCTVSALQNLASNYLDLHQPDAAVSPAEQALKLCIDRAGKDDPDTLASATVLTRVYKAANQPEKAAAHLREFLPQLLESLVNDKSQLGSDSMALAQKQREIAFAQINGGMYREAELNLSESLAIRTKWQPSEGHTYLTMFMLGEALNGQGKYDEADPLLLQGYEGMRRDLKVRHWRNLILGLDRLVQFYEDTNQPDKVCEWQERLASTRAAIRAKRAEQASRNSPEVEQESALPLTEN
jgi:serine/threonine protein kinase/tetratricopeptide (TPR) repeat protein